MDTVFQRIIKLAAIAVCIAGVAVCAVSCSEKSEAQLLRVTSIEPREGMPGDTVLISGTFFSPVPGENLVKFGAKYANVAKVESNRLKVVVPQGAVTGPVSVFANNYIDYSPVFTLKITSPVVLSVQPGTIKQDDFMDIHGLNFSGPIVTFTELPDMAPLQVFSESSPTFINTRSHFGIPPGTYHIKVTCKGISSNTDITITIIE